MTAGPEDVPAVEVSLRPAAVYRCYDDQNALLYIGRTVDPPRRLREHLGKEWWRDVVAVLVEHYPDLASACEAEACAITAEFPRWNIRMRAPEPEAVAPRPATMPAPRLCMGPLCLRRNWALTRITDVLGRWWVLCWDCAESFRDAGRCGPAAYGIAEERLIWDAVVEFHVVDEANLPGWPARMADVQKW